MLLAGVQSRRQGIRSPQYQYILQPGRNNDAKNRKPCIHARLSSQFTTFRCATVRVQAVSSETGKGRGRAPASGPPARNSKPQDWSHVDSHYFLMANGSELQAHISASTAGNVRILMRLERGEPCFLHWGLYRGSLDNEWMLPEALLSKDSILRTDLQAIHTPLVPVENSSRQVMEGAIYIPRSLLPCFVTGSIFVDDPGNERLLTLRHSQYFSVPVGVSRGTPMPLGARIVPKLTATVTSTVSAQGTDEPSGSAAKHSNASMSKLQPTNGVSINFSVISRHARGMTLRLFRMAEKGLSNQAEKSLDLALHPSQHRTGDVWHIQVDNLSNLHSMVYAWEAIGPLGWRGQGRFAPGAPLLDPYATRARRVRLPQSEAGGREIWAGVMPSRSGSGVVAMNEGDDGLSSDDDQPEKQHQRPQHAMESSFLLEVDPATFAGLDRVKDPRLAGKWLGVLERVDDIVATGATTVVLPCAMLRGDGLGVQGLAALSYFIADGRYAAGGKPESADEEFLELVKGLHDRGIEVLMQVELCFTAEGDDTCPKVVSLRGLDHALYYRPNALLNLAQPAVVGLVRDALRYWTKQFSLDGFVLLSAEAIAQSTDGTVLDTPPLAELLANDAVLRGCKLVAWPRDYSLLPRHGRRGFPHAAALLQHNGAFGAILQWLGSSGPELLTSVATQLTGNASMLQADWSPEASLPGNLAVGRRPSFGVNTISSPLVDGTSLQSWIDSVLGVESVGDRKRVVMAKSAILLMMLSRGTPQASAVDLEMMEVARFYQAALAVRLKEDWSKLLRPLFEEFCDVQWFSGHGQEPNWDQGGPGSEVLGLVVRAGGALGKAVSIVVNSGDGQVRVSLPQSPGRSLWTVVLDSGAMPPDDVLIQSGGHRLPAGSGLVLAPKAAAFLFAAPSALSATASASPPSPSPLPLAPVRGLQPPTV